MQRKNGIVAVLVALWASSALAAGDQSKQVDDLWKAMQAAAPSVNDDTNWYAVRAGDGAPCPASLKGRRPEAAFAAVPGIALIKAEQTKLPDGATLLSANINNNGRVERLEFTNMHGACMVLTEMRKRQRATRAQDDAKLGKPVSWSAQLPASRVVMSFETPCSIEEVVVRHPEARSGREIKPNGDYLESCWWDDGGDNMMLHTPFGSSRAISKAAISVQRRK